MNLPRLAINRPIATLMIVALAMILGVFSMTLLQVDLLPDITFPVAVAYVRYPGAGPLEVERMVVRPVEEAVGSVNNVRSVRSTSYEEGCFVVAEFNWGADMDFSALEMREKIEQVRRFMPADAEAPVVMKINPSMMPFLQLSLSGGRDLPSLKAMAEDIIVSRLERIEGVAAVDVVGGQRREVTVSVDLDRMYSAGIDLSTLVQALRSENLNLPGGRIEQGGQRLLVRSVGEFRSVDEIAQVPIASPIGGSAQVGEFARITDGLALEAHRARLNGNPSIGLSIQKRPDANTVQVASLVLAAMNDLTAALPSDVSFEVALNSSKFITSAVNGVISNAVIGAVLAVFILFVFLQSLKSTLAIAIAIPIAIVSSLTLLNLAGLTVNLMSLGGLALGIGMLVDTAIVVLENIFRHREQGKDPLTAAADGTNEVAAAVFASTLTTIGVFLPVVFLSGLASELFRELALTVSFALATSLLVSLTVIPLVSSRLFVTGPPAARGRVMRSVHRLLEDTMKSNYRHLLEWALNHRLIVLGTAAILFGGSLLLIPAVGTEFMPPMNTGEFIIDVKLPRGATLEETDRVVSEVEQRLLTDPRIQTVFATAGSGSGMFLAGGSGEQDRGNIKATMTQLAKREESVFAVVDELRKTTADVPGARIDIRVFNSLMDAMSGSPIVIQIQGDELDVLRNIARDVGRQIETIHGVRDVQVSAEEGQPELRIIVDRDHASHLGLSAAQVGTTVRTAVQGDICTRLRIDGDEIDVRVIAGEQYRSTVQAITGLALLSRQGHLVSLGEIAKLAPAQGPIAIDREGQARTATVTAQLYGRSLGDVSHDLQADVDAMDLPPGYSIEVGGERRQMTDAFSTLSQAGYLAVILVYGMLAALFESLVHPFVIMFTVPLAFIGVLLSLVLTGRTLNIVSFLGGIMLAGIVVNNAIVMIDYLNQLRSRGMGLRQAVLTAGETRLRPILMTSLTTILALLPLAFGIGDGAELQAPLATVVIGGLLMSTTLTLVVVPVVYELVDEIGDRIKPRRRSNA